jgi:RNA polymerase sigma-70 factor (ECF subfamily)
MADGPEAALRIVESLAGDERLARTYLLHATRADLLRRLGRNEEAAAAYQRAFELAPTRPERAFLERRRDALLRDPPAPG